MSVGSLFRKILLMQVLAICIPSVIHAQQRILVDQVVAIVGSDVIMRSDIESQYLNWKMQNNKKMDESDIRCMIMDEMLVSKLMLNQAKIDSIEVSETNVEMSLKGRMDYFLRYFESTEKMEEYFKKSLIEIKEEFRGLIREQLITDEMKQKVTMDLTTTPSDIAKFYKNLNPDSIPVVNAQVELQQIAIYPKYSEEAILQVKDRLLELRKRVLNGEKFSTLAILYSEDPGSARLGGEIGLMSKGELDPEYAKAAWALKKNGVSNIVESQFGYHLIQLIDRKEDLCNTRHILMKPVTNRQSIIDAKNKLDSIMQLVKADSLTFDKAALYFSQDKNSRFNNGLLVNKQNGSSKFKMDQLNQTEYYAVKELKVGDYSQPFETVDENNKPVYKVYKLVSRTEPHKANIEQDYELIQQMTLNEKRNTYLMKWIQEKSKTTFIQIDPSFKNCPYRIQWVKSE